MKRMVQAKPKIEKAHQKLLDEHYDLSDRPATGVTMSGGKPVQERVRIKLPKGVAWESLSVFHIKEVKKQNQRDLQRFDLDLPDHVLPEFPPPIYLTTRPDLGDVSQGKLVTINNYFQMFNGLLNPKQLESLRLLVTPFPQQQFNATEDRRVKEPSLGVTCFDCHANGYTNAATHLLGDIRPQEQRAAYFDGDTVIATKLNIYGRLDPSKASKAELRGEDIFFGKGTCSTCHTPPYYTDNLMHDLQVERFFKPKMINGRLASADGKIKPFPLRGIKNSPPYLHDDRLLTLEDTVEFFNLVLQIDLTDSEKKDLVAFLRQSKVVPSTPAPRKGLRFFAFLGLKDTSVFMRYPAILEDMGDRPIIVVYPHIESSHRLVYAVGKNPLNNFCQTI